MGSGMGPLPSVQHLVKQWVERVVQAQCKGRTEHRGLSSHGGMAGAGKEGRKLCMELNWVVGGEEKQRKK